MAQERRRWEEMTGEDRRGRECTPSRRDRLGLGILQLTRRLIRDMLSPRLSPGDSPDDDSDNDLSNSGDRNKRSASGPVPNALPLLAVLAVAVIMNPFIVVGGRWSSSLIGISLA